MPDAEIVPPQNSSAKETITKYEMAKEVHRLQMNALRMAYFSIAAMLIVLGGSLSSFWIGSLFAVIGTIFYGIIAAKGILKTKHLQDKYGVPKEKLFTVPTIG